MPMETIRNIHFSESARREIELILANDFTLKDKGLRIHISGKGCDGFTYGVGWDSPKGDDLSLIPEQFDSPFSILLDPFTQKYLQSVKIDFIFSPETDEEGLVITNPDEKSFRGKFWRKT